MTSCSLVADGLVSQYSGQVPTFSYRRTGHSTDYFGIQMTYMNGASTCYGGRPSFTPVILNPAQGFSVGCTFAINQDYSGIYCSGAPVTRIPDGVLTVSYRNWNENQPTPVPFLATFGPPPGPTTVTATTGAVVTSTATQTSTISPGFASTATAYTAGTTETYTNTIIVTRTQTTVNTNYVSSCAAPPVVSSSSSSSSSSSRTSSSTASAFPSPSGLSNSCPADNGKYVYTSAGTFQITCNYDRDGVTTGLFHPGNGLLGCIDLCATTKGCVWSTYYNAQDACYLKFGTGNYNYNTAAWGANLITASSSSTPVPSTSSASSSRTSSQLAISSPEASSSSAVSAPAPSPSASGLKCPGADGQTYMVGSKMFQVVCNYDRDGITQGLFHTGNGLTGCITLCANTQDCLWSTYYAAQDACYLKFGQGVPNYNTAASGARWLNPPSSSSVISSPAASSVPASSVVVSSSPAASLSSSPVASLSSTSIASSTPSSPAPSPPSSGAASRSSSLAVSHSSTPAQSPSSSPVASQSSSAVGSPSSPAVRTSSSAAVTSSSSSVVSSASLPSVTPTSITCPDDNGKSVNTASGAFVVECYIDRAGGDLSTRYPGGGFNGCVQLCANTPTCVDVSYIPNGPCYLKNALGTPNINSGVWGARSVAIAVSSSAAPSTAASTATASPPAATSSNSPTCPGSDGKIFYYNGDVFLVECYTDYAGSDLASGTPQYFNSFGGCVNACATNKACNAVSYVGGTCYLKGTVNSGSSNPNVWGAKQIGTYDGTTTQITTTPTARASSSSVAMSSAAASPSSTGAAGSNIACPGDDGKTFTTSAGTFVIECYIDRNNNDLGPAISNPTSYAGCLNACAATTGCQAVSYVPNGPCYLKNGIGAANTNNAVWGARLGSAVRSSATVATSSAATTTSTGPVATSSVVCPGSDGQTITTSAGRFLVECGIDRSGNDMANSPVYPGSFEACVAVCAGRTGCVGVSYIPYGPCYLKSSAGTANQNANIVGGRLISGPSSSSAAASSSIATSSSVVAPSSVVASSAPASSPVATSGASSPVQTVTVTTTIGGTGYQCACTPTSRLGSGPASSAAASTPAASSAAALGCPSSNGSTFTSNCGATYAIECYSDRYGDDIPGGTSYTNTLNDCIVDCDKTNGCIDVSYTPGSPGPCYKKSNIAEIRQNNNIYGARQLTQCKASSKLKLHRKRVVRTPTEPKKEIQKRGIYGPDSTYIREVIRTTQTTTSTEVHTTTVTTTPANVGTTTRTVYTTAYTATTVTSGATATQTQQTTVTTCPAVTRRAVL